MEQVKRRRFGIIASIVLAILLVAGVAGFAISAANATKADTLERVKTTGKIVWGVKTDTKLFGLMNTATGKPEGFDIDIADAVTKKIGQQIGKELKIEYVPVTATSKMQLLKNGNIDGTVSTVTITDERKKIIDFTDPYFDAGQAILVKNGSGIKSVKDLNNKKYTVLAITGTTAVDTLKEFAPKTRALLVSDYGQAMAALKSGQGDAITTDNAILYGLAVQNPGYSVVGGTFTNQPYGIAFDKGQTKMTAATNKALKELIADGTYNKLIDKWFGGVKGVNVKELYK
ncbi:MAG TPA: transporter substrate-binding domain-containing protein [Lactobacillaceae bacterium]|jgi:putative glutamine transport system substrate-binding protein